jgi:hypothetical protein
LLGQRANRIPLVTSNVALELRSLRSTIITRFFATTDLSDPQGGPAPILADRQLPWLAPPHRLGSPVLTPLSFAHIPPPLPRSSRKMLITLSSLPGFGLRFAPTFSTGTLGFSRLARRSIFIVVCTLADSLNEPFASRASTGRSPYRIASTASGWNVSCRAGYLPPAGFRRPFTARRSLALPENLALPRASALFATPTRPYANTPTRFCRRPASSQNRHRTEPRPTRKISPYRPHCLRRRHAHTPTRRHADTLLPPYQKNLAGDFRHLADN